MIRIEPLHGERLVTDPLEQAYEDMKGGNVVFIQALAGALIELDRQPCRRWTTAALRTVVENVLRDVGINQDVPGRHYVHARLLLELLQDALDGLQAERLLESFDPPDLDTKSN